MTAASQTAAATDKPVVAATLAEHHRELVEASGISPEVSAERGYWTATKKTELQVLGFSPAQRNVPALVVPIRDAAGEVVNYQVRPDTPRIGDTGKPLKYESPAGMPPTLDVPLRCREGLRSVHAPLWITEGARKADAAASAGLCCVSLPGVWSWVRRLNADARQVLPDLQRVRLDERKVVVAFDSDVMAKRQVHAALEALAEYLRSQGALVHFAYLPEPEPGVKCGLDDFLAARARRGAVGARRGRAAAATRAPRASAGPRSRPPTCSPTSTSFYGGSSTFPMAASTHGSRSRSSRFTPMPSTRRR